MSVFKCFRTRTSFIKPKHRRLLAFTNPVSPSKSGLEGLLVFFVQLRSHGKSQGDSTGIRPAEEKAYSNFG